MANAGYGGKYGAGNGAFKIRNSWGVSFGDQGHWYLPYSMIEQIGSQPEVWSNYENFVYITDMTS